MALPGDIVQAFNHSGLTQDALARRVGVNRATLNAWFTGRVTPRGRNIVRLRQELGLEKTPTHDVAADGDILTVDHFLIDQGRLTKTERQEVVDATLAQSIPPERLGTLTIPAGWDNMLLYIKPGDRLLLDVFMEPRNLTSIIIEDRFVDGVYLVAFSGSLQIRRLQELPDRTIAVLNDNTAYRDVELNLDAGDDLVLHARVLAAEGPA
ncbi:MAG: LexA family transcriptional regulator [Bacteroidetes bacterium]|nr:LexA family transcriptional regulator [Bacteroidota bacterium]